VSRTRERAEAYAQRHGIPDAYTDYARVLERPDVEVVDLCVPNYLHRPMTEAAAAAGKHVICSKPLTAFDGASLSDGVEASSVPRSEMLRVAADNAAAMVDATHRAGVQLMYGENWVYAPSIAKADRLATASGGTIKD
jgi:predicted dehydrogenase